MSHPPWPVLRSLIGTAAATATYALEQLLQKAQTVEKPKSTFGLEAPNFCRDKVKYFSARWSKYASCCCWQTSSNGSTMIEVHAYTDDIGDAQYNLRLRESRSAVMLHLLMSAGIDKRHLRSILPLDVRQIRRVRAAGFRVVIVGSSSMGDSK